MYIVVASLIVLFLFLNLRVHALVLSFIVALVLYMRFAYYSIAWFPSIILVRFLLAKVYPLICFWCATQGGLDLQSRKLLLYIFKVLARQNSEVYAISCVLGCLFY